MSLAANTIAVTPGSGANVATNQVAAKDYQVVMQANVDGQVVGSRPVYFFLVPNQVHVAAASTIHWDLFNAHATLKVRVMMIQQLPDIVTAVTGVATNWTMQRTTAVGTGGTAQTAWLPNTGQTALDGSITCRSKPTGGATAGTQLKAFSVNSEETTVATQVLHSLMMGGACDLVPALLRPPYSDQGILLGQNQGISVTQTTNSAAGNTGWLVGFTVE